METCFPLSPKQLSIVWKYVFHTIFVNNIKPVPIFCAADRDLIRADLHRDIQAILTLEQIPLHEAMLEEMRATPPRRFPPR